MLSWTTGSTGALAHMARCTLAVLLSFAALAALAPRAALAHAALRSSVPAPGTIVEGPVHEVRLRFSQPVEPRYTTATLAGPTGELKARAAEVVPGSGGREVSLALDDLGPGEYVVAWRAGAKDGHVVSGRFSFTVKPAAHPTRDDASELTPSEANERTQSEANEITPSEADIAVREEPPTAWHEDAHAHDEPFSLTTPLPIVIRWLHLVALLGMIGVVAFHLVVLPLARRRSGTPGSELVSERAWWLGMLATAMLAIAIVGRLWAQSAVYHGIEMAWDGEALRHLVLGTTWGKAWLLEVIAGAAFFVGLLLTRGRPAQSRWALAAGAILALSLVPPLSGHAATVERLQAIAIVIDALHVLGAGAWLGTLLVLLLACILRPSREGHASGPSLAELVTAFSPLALAAAATVAASGLANALFQFSMLSDLWSTRYGVTLLVKVGVVALVAAAGFHNWRRVLPALKAGAFPRRLLFSASLELLFAAAVILATAVLVALPRP